ncbi:bifunctional hydroxymethylpyrimidine kinase/phosphomethylpyrimidine kinase [bacterium]|nr:MAG: bifunctional hydroxymethylpyrimidine kinase/phosphomethylpyrimidine kinase [bacterium]
MKKVLTIAGSDSGGGAGIQADLRVFALLGCHGASAITALTAQNSLGVQSVHPVEPEVLGAQMRSVLSDIGADAAKTGMLFNEGLIREAALELDIYPVEKLVVDPVMVAKGGASLLRDDAVAALQKFILPKALVVTPNIPEAEALSGVTITNLETTLLAMERILETGPKAVLLKGGHVPGRTVTDFLWEKDREVEAFTSPRIETQNTHGTGCTLSAAIAAYLARGETLRNAVARARAFLYRAIAHGYETGAGHGSTNPYEGALGGGERALMERLFTAWELLEEENPVGLIPEVQSNLAEALDGAQTFDDVAGFPGRIIKAGGRIRRVDGPRFGATRHMAKILLASIRHQSPFRAVMNVRYGLEVVEACRRAGLSVASFSRDDEPPEVKAAEGSTLEWGTSWVLETKGFAPDVIYDEGDRGKEPMIRIFGTDAIEVAKRVNAVWRELKGG